MTSSVPSDNDLALYRRVVEEFEKRGWRDDGATALALARRLSDGTSPVAAANTAPSSFRARNAAGVPAIAAALEAAARAHPRPLAPFADSATYPTETARTLRGRAASAIAHGSLATGAGILILTVNVVLVLPQLLGWDWLLSHENRFAIQAAGTLAGAGLAWAAWRPSQREPAVGSLAIGAIILLASLLGGPS